MTSVLGGMPRIYEKHKYTLEFEKIDILRISHKKVNAERSEVNVSLDISSGTWGMSSEERVLEFKKLLSGRHVRVTEGDTYASVKLCKDGI